MIIYLFDINGTLAPADSTMNSEFQTFFLDWMKDKHVVLTSKSGKSFIVSKIGSSIWTASKRIYHENAKLLYRGSTGPDAKPISIISGRPKTEILDDFEHYRKNYWTNCHVNFFSDDCNSGGEDYDLAQKLITEWATSNKTHTINKVDNYTDTWNILKT